MKYLFFALIIRPIILLFMGVSVTGREHLKLDSASIIVANHNSHIDTLVLMCLFPLAKIERVHPLAAADYFFSNRLRSWLSTHFIGAIGIRRSVTKTHPNPFSEAELILKKGQSIILFPEGSRGNPEKMKPFKCGIGHLASTLPEVPIIPIFIFGAGKSLPKGEALFVPFIVDVNIGEPIYTQGLNHKEITKKIEQAVIALKI